MKQLTINWGYGNEPLTRASPHNPSHFPFVINATNKFSWFGNNLPYAFCGITYLDITELEMKRKNTYKSNTEFVTIRLSKEDKPKFEDWAKTNIKSIFKYLRELGEGGYKLSISPDFNNACVIFSITGTENSVANVSCCMTSRAEDVEEAIMLGCYKHFVMANGDSWVDIAEERTDNWG